MHLSRIRTWSFLVNLYLPSRCNAILYVKISNFFEIVEHEVQAYVTESFLTVNFDWILISFKQILSILGA